MEHKNGTFEFITCKPGGSLNDNCRKKIVDFSTNLYYIIDNIPATPLNNAQLSGFFIL